MLRNAMATHHRLSALLFGTTFISLLTGAPRSAHASDFYGRVLLGPAYFHNDDVSGRDSSGYGLAGQLDVGARLTPWGALHATLIADDSRSVSFDGAILGEDYQTTVLGLGLGATGTWQRWSLAVATGAQLTWHPDAINPNDGASGAGLGPFVSGTAGYAFPVSDQLQLGAQLLARYRVGKDDVDPSGYELGLGVSLALADDRFEAAPDEAGAPAPRPLAPRDSSVAISAQLGWWNAELELLIDDHLYVALGGPWLGIPFGLADGRPLLPFGARLGYQLDASPRWKLRAAAHLAGMYGSGAQCLDCESDAYGTDSWQLFEVGARYESGAGWVYGVDVPLFVINDVLGLDNHLGEQDPFFAPPLSLAFLQVYAGYSWAL